MSVRLGPRLVSFGVAGAAYVLACHWLMTRAPASPWNAVGVLMPMLVALTWGAWRAGQHALGCVAGLAIVGLCGQALIGLRISSQGLYLAQHAGVHVFLALGFGATLRAGRDPLITTLARRVHRHFPPEMAAYTRHVTLAWTVFFVAMALASVLLYGLGPFERWALFANLGTPLAVAAMFAAEYALRYRLHPEFERTTVADAVRAYLNNEQAAAPAPRHDGLA